MQTKGIGRKTPDRTRARVPIVIVGKGGTPATPIYVHGFASRVIARSDWGWPLVTPRVSGRTHSGVPLRIPRQPILLMGAQFSFRSLLLGQPMAERISVFSNHSYHRVILCLGKARTVPAIADFFPGFALDGLHIWRGAVMRSRNKRPKVFHPHVPDREQNAISSRWNEFNPKAVYPGLPGDGRLVGIRCLRKINEASANNCGQNKARYAFGVCRFYNAGHNS